MVVVALVVAPAFGAFAYLHSFGKTGTGAGRIGPHATGIAVAPDGRVYVADASEGRVEAFLNDGTPDGGWAAPAITDVAAAPDGTVLVAGAGGVQRFAADGTGATTLDPDVARAVAAGPDGAVYVASAHQVDRLGDGTVFADDLESVSAVAVAPDGTVYVADHDEGEVHAFSADGTPASSFTAPDPEGLAVAPDGSVLVSDEHGQRVLVFDAAGQRTATFGDGGTGKLNRPLGVATDCRGSAYVVDNSALRVHVFGEEGDPPPCAAPEAPAPEPPAVQSDPVVAPPAVEVASVVAQDEEPILGVRGRATPVSGEVLVAKKGGALHELTGRELLPVGSTVDASKGHVLLEFEAAHDDRPIYGRLMSGEFYDGAFTISQKTTASIVDLQLFDEPATAGSSLAHASKAKKSLKVWGKAKGRFRTVGRNGAATVRGTQWLTQERAEGTFFAVREGVVGVRDFRTGKLHILRAGDSYLARPGCVSRRKFRIHLRVPPGTRLKTAVVTVGGKRVAVRRGRRATAPIDLRGQPAGKVVVKITVRTRDGRTVTGRRVYHTCASKRPVRTPPVV